MFFLANILGLSELKSVPKALSLLCRKAPSFSALQAVACTTSLWLAATFRYALSRTSIGRSEVWLPLGAEDAVFAGPSLEAPRKHVLFTTGPDANVLLGSSGRAVQSLLLSRPSWRFVAASHNFKMKWTRHTSVSSPSCARTSLAQLGLCEHLLRATYLRR